MMADADQRRQANRRIVRRLGMAAAMMFGFGFVLVPLYDVFCDITGLNGKTGRIEQEKVLGGTVDKDRLVTVEFMSTVHNDLPWEFKPMVRRIKVHPGEVTEVHYYARNLADAQVAGHAVPSVAPGQAAKYFNKTECFCFTRQTLEAGEYKEMPLRFVVDPALPEGVRTVSLSYTFFQAKEDAPAETISMEKKGSLESIM